MTFCQEGGPSDQVMSLFTIVGVLLGLASLWLNVRLDVWKKENQNALDEIRRCNDEFIRATRLFAAGQIDDAIEMSGRWRYRCKDHTEKQRQWWS